PALPHPSLDEFLKSYPWPEPHIRQKGALNYLWSFELPASPEKLWPYVTDTAGTNRRLGLPEMQLEERAGKLYGKSTRGLTAEWEELPWEWEYARELKVARAFHRGPAI